MTITQLYEIYNHFPSIETDTRKLKKNDIFFALRGENFNGNQFALQALQQGAAYVVVDENLQENDARIIQVDNVLQTLQDLAKYHRRQFNIPFIAITGSNGKTTTKELINAVLSGHFKTYTTHGNLNNHIGIPLTILNVKKDAQIAVIEMGASHPKEIENYCRYALPTHGIITNCGKAHLEGFGDEEGVRKAKGELYDFIRANGGTVLAFDDYDYLHAMAAKIDKVFWYGTHKGDVVGNALGLNTEPFLQLGFKIGDINVVNTQLVGGYNLPNVLCAVAAGILFEVPYAKIVNAIQEYSPDNSRSQMIVKGSNKIILDAYNANPSSMKLAIENFINMDVAKKVIIIGGMMELGKTSIEEHKTIVTLLQEYAWDHVVLVGGDFGKIDSGYTYFANSLQAAEWYNQQCFEHAHILVKGSRSMKMERVIN